MKVIHIAHWFPSERNAQSGVFVKEYCNAIHEDAPGEALILFVDIIRSNNILPDLKIKNDETSRHIRVIRLEIRWILWALLFTYPQLQWYFYKRVLLSVAGEFSPEIIHAHVVHPSGALGYKLAGAVKKPLIITEHWSNLHAYVRKPVSSFLGKKAYRAALHILPVSRFLEEMIRQVLPDLDPGKIIVVPDVVDENVFSYREKPEKQEGTCKFLAVSSWNRYRKVSKRPDLIIQSLARFARESSSKVQLTMIGDGNMLDELHGMAEALSDTGLTVVFAGKKTKPEISAFLHETDYFIHASNIETFSLVTAEALMTGTPVIVSNEGALPHLVNDQSGVVCNNTLEEWVVGLKELVIRKFNHLQIAAEMKGRCSYAGVRHQVQTIYRKVTENSAGKR